MSRRTKRETIGPWTLVELLGQGGNAEVWRATDAEKCIALKILNQRKANSESYQRFRQEVAAFSQIGMHAGVIPLLDHHLPDVPSKKVPAWLTMPIAVPLAESLSEKALREVVTAVAEIADTLADLHERLQIHHRDIKPSNLYLLDGHPAISDFGLVDLPDANDLTVAGRPLGPKFFLAYEMVVDSAQADPAAADVFSLAKTLWVLCVDQRWPPQGEQQASNEAYSIGKYRPHPLSQHLDELIERCTQHDPVARPSMREVSGELRAWLALDNATPQQTADLSAMWAGLRDVAEPRLRQVEEEAAHRQCFVEAVREFQRLMEPLHAEIRQQFPAAEFNQRRKFVETLFYDGSKHETTNEDIRATILSGAGWDPVRLIVGMTIRTKASGEVEFGGAFYLGRTETMGGHIDSWQPDRRSIPCRSIALKAGLAGLAVEMQATFPAWLGEFVTALRSSGA